MLDRPRRNGGGVPDENALSGWQNRSLAATLVSRGGNWQRCRRSAFSAPRSSVRAPRHKATITMSFPLTHPALARALAAKDYAVPTAVQSAVLEERANGRDLVVSAQTGSGKTVAFGLAFAPTLLGDAERFGRAGEPMALIIAPTRELAMQVQRELVWLYAETDARIVTCVGGMDPKSEARQLQQGAHIVVGTPGRLRDHLERRRLNLNNLKVAVLDEADEMLDLGFREDLEFILKATPDTRRTLLFSATVPREIEALARTYQNDALRIETTRRDEQHADIEYQAMRVSPGDIENAIVNVLRFHEARATLVFCGTREAVKRTHARLQERGFSAVALSGELTQHERTQALVALRDGRARVLVATDVAARGLDLPDLTLVIHADLPNDRETLLHRSGRTGRAGRKGHAVMLVPFNRRRKADTLIGGARLKVTWTNVPGANDIRAKDQERFLGDPMFTESVTEAEQGFVHALQAGRTPEEIALALIRMQRSRLPEPEDMAADSGPPRRDDRQNASRENAGQGSAGRGTAGRGRSERFERNDRPERVVRSERAPSERAPSERAPSAPAYSDRAAANSSSSDRTPSADRLTDRAPDRDRTSPDRLSRGRVERFDATRDYRNDRGSERAPRATRDDGRAMVWFRLNIGRERNADPRWILPLICKAGGITKAEIGAIRIHDRDTRFQVLATEADAFTETVRTSKDKEGHISRVRDAGDGGLPDLTAPPSENDNVVAAALASLPDGAPRERKAKYVPKNASAPKTSSYRHDGPRNSPTGPSGYAKKKKQRSTGT